MKKNNLIPSLNGLRAISIIMVVMHHLIFSHILVITSAPLKLLSYFFLDAALGVNIFFIISGFLITTLLITEKEKTNKISLKNFYIRRIFRIFPAYYCLLFILFILQCLNHFHISLISWLSVILYLKQFVPTNVWEIGHLWSLSVEEVFYIIFPALFSFFFMNLRKVLLWLIIVFAFSRFLFYAYPLPIVSNSIFSTGDALLIGCLLALKKNDVIAFITSHPNISLFVFPMLIISDLSYSYVYKLSLNLSGQDFGLSFKIVQRIVYTFFGSIGLITNMIIAYIIIMSIYLKNLWYRLLNTQILNFIGVLSYSIYLWQQIFTADREWIHKYPIYILLFITFSISLLSYYVIEKPFLKLREKYITK